MNKGLDSVAISGYYLRESLNKETIYGRNVAAKELLEGFLKYSTAKELCFCYVKKGFQHNMLSKLYRSVEKEHKVTDIRIVDRIDMLQKNEMITSDIIHDCVEDFYHTLYLRQRFAKHNVPISMTVHCASQPNLFKDNVIHSLLAGMKPYDTIFCSSKSVKNVLEKQFDNIIYHFKDLYNVDLQRKFRLDIVPLGLDDKKLQRVDMQRAREELRIPNNAFTILFFGRVSAYFKGDIMPLLKVVKRLVDKNPNKNIQLIIAGTENYELHDYKYIRKYISRLSLDNNVIIFEEFDYKKRNLLYCAADVFTSPTDSIQETFGLTPIEAMALGVPQVVSDWDGYRETVKHEETGFLVETSWIKCEEDISSFPLALMDEFGDERFYSHFLLGQSVIINLEKYEYYFQLLMDNERLRKEMSKKSCQHFQDNYLLTKTIQGYETVWKELIDEKRKYEQVSEKQFLDLYHNRYFEMFCEYPSKILDESITLQITEEGEKLLEDPTLIPWHYAEEKKLNEVETAMKLLEYMKTVETIKFKELALSFHGNVNEYVVKRGILWLLKHGFILYREEQ